MRLPFLNELPMERKEIQPSESYPLAVLLALTGGFLDAYTYVCRDGVFANAQTGNFARLAMSLANAHWLLALRYLLPILSFIAGVTLAMRIRARCQGGRLHWRQISVLLEIALLAIVSLIPAGEISNIAANIVVSFTCAIQVETFRKFLGSVFASTMCTGNLRSATETLNHYFEDRDPNVLRKSLRYYGIDLTFVAGCAFGTLMTKLLGIAAVLCCCALLLAVFLMMFRRPIERKD